ncbi:MAG: PocR ligand-binding domain-containing protein, partial [Butyricicoccus sp.]
MELQEQALHFCTHIETLTGAHSTMLDLPAADFCTPPFRCNCALKNGVCDAYQTHLYGSYEAERWDGKYVYYCPRGFVFIATTLRQPGAATEYCLITGPFIMSNSDEDAFEDDAIETDPLDGVPRLTTAQARALNELVHAVCGYLTGVPATPDVDSGRQAEILQMMYDLSEQATPASYPLDSERKLQQQIRDGDKEGSQKLLNELLCQLYFVSGTNLEIFKARVRELLTLMSRAAIDGGADVNEVFSLCYHCEKEVEN